MRRFVLAVAATSAGVVLLLGATGLVAARSFVGPRVAEAAALSFGGPMGADLHPDLQGLRDLSPSERFARFLGVEMRYRDENNTVHTMNATPGTVASISQDKLTITPNQGGGSKTYNLTGDTRVVSGGPWRGGQGQSSQATLNSGDKVVVMTLDGSSDARVVRAGEPGGFGPHRKG